MKSRKIQVRKRDGRIEPFDRARLAGVIASVIIKQGGSWQRANDIAEIIELYLKRTNQTLVSSKAVFEMAVKALQRIGMQAAAKDFEFHSTLRNVRRKLLRVSHSGGKFTLWDKSWFAQFAQRSWNVSWRTARILAGETETEALTMDKSEISREELIEILNCKVCQLGLADAVPVDQFTASNKSLQDV